MLRMRYVRNTNKASRVPKKVQAITFLDQTGDNFFDQTGANFEIKCVAFCNIAW